MHRCVYGAAKGFGAGRGGNEGMRVEPLTHCVDNDGVEQVSVRSMNRV